MTRFPLALAAIASFACAAQAAKDEPLKTRWFDLASPTIEERLCQVGVEVGKKSGDFISVGKESVPPKLPGRRQDHYQDALEGTWKDAFAEYGVAWPDGSRIRYFEKTSKLLVRNTEANLALVETVLCLWGVLPSQVQITLEIVAFPKEMLDALARQGGMTTETVGKAYEDGKGKLLAAPTAVTQSGQEATVKGVEEWIYPTELDTTAHTGSGSNATIRASSIMPAGCETREVGVILTVLPEVSAGGQMISLTLAPERVLLPQWRDYDALLSSPTGTTKTTLPTPIFQTDSVTTTVTLTPGARALVGGGTPAAHDGSIVCMFVTARLLDMSGRPIKPPDLTALGDAVLAQ